MIVIGIDPGKTTAIAVYDKENKKITSVSESDFWGCYRWLDQGIKDSQGYSLNTVECIVIEVPRTKTNWHKKGCDITSANVGGIYREAELLADGIGRLGFKVIRQHPQGKYTHKQVVKLTGWTERTNEHKRDAIMLCFGH